MINRTGLKNEIDALVRYIEKEEFKGYDPYDTLLSFLPFDKLGKWIPAMAIQVQKRNPVNIRPFLGIKKAINPKAFGLLLHAYCLIYQKEPKDEYRKTMDYLFSWLKNNYSKNYSGICWGYNFPWANPDRNLPPFVPSSVVTGFICRGIFMYYKITGDEEARSILKSAMQFVTNDLNITEDETGLCYSYTPLEKDICYNASLLAAEILAINYSLFDDPDAIRNAVKAVDFVIARQKSSGVWAYSENKQTGKERIQTDFHQGYVLSSIHFILNTIRQSDQKTVSGLLTDVKQLAWEEAIKNGCRFYKENQFFSNGQSLWRLPKKWPVEIHNQAQGIITFTMLRDICPEYLSFSDTIYEWTAKNMKSSGAYFYYQKFRYYSNKIPYMRWSQAWMLLAMASLYTSDNLASPETNHA